MLKILFENEDYLIVDKQAGITVNRSDTTSGEVTLQDLVEEYFARRPVARLARLQNFLGDAPPAPAKSSHPGAASLALLQKFRKLPARKSPFDTPDTFDTFRQRSGIVHRLDKETSGILIVAKNSQTFRALQSQFKERKVEKSYIALVHGQIQPKSGDINVPIGRLPWNRKRFGVLAGGRNAITKYKVLSTAYLVSKGKQEPLSLVRLYPKTGRTHQIRVHLKYIGHPIFGDPLYAGRKTSRQDRALLPRIFLHAQALSFEDPKTGEKVQFKSELPEDLEKFVNNLEKIVN